MAEIVEFKFKQGAQVKDKVTHMVGTVTARTEHLNGCLRYTIQPKVDKENKFVDAYWVDEAQLELVKGARAVKVKKNEKGGPSKRARSNKASRDY